MVSISSGGHRGEIAAPFVGFEQDFVGEDVEFFLDFALDVLRFVAAQDVPECAFAYGMADDLAGAADDFQQ